MEESGKPNRLGMKDNQLASIDPVIVNFGDDDDNVSALDLEPQQGKKTPEEARAHDSIFEMPTAIGEKVIFPILHQNYYHWTSSSSSNNDTHSME